jgi:predicted Zn-dependent protease
MTLKQTLALSIAALTTLNIQAQSMDEVHRCGTTEKVAELMAAHPEYQRTQFFEQNEQAKLAQGVYTIPVVVHVLYANAAQNISDAQIHSQFDVLNRDFRKLNADSIDIPANFAAVSADIEIEFCLAEVDPDGNPTTGITRTSVSSNFDIYDNYYKVNQGGVAPWDNTQYLNIWVGNLGQGLLGFATPPPAWGTPGNWDGAVFNYKTWGDIEAAAGNAPYNLGRTAVHEIGHYLNLDHTWGAGNGGCNDDDGVTDTPPQNAESYGCETYPHTDNCSPTGDGVMFMNFMDYSNDACLLMFTEGQKTKMHNALTGKRSSLLNSNAICDNISIVKEEELHFTDISPNPATDHLWIASNAKAELNIFSLSGAIVSARTLDKGKSRIDVGHLENGIYFLQINNLENGTNDFHKVVIAH